MKRLTTRGVGHYKWIARKRKATAGLFIMSSVPSSASTDSAGGGKQITITLAEQGGRRFFTASCQKETIPLDDSAALNRWAAVGLVDRHKLTLKTEGIILDDHLIAFDDPNAVQELEHRLNRPQTAAKHQTPAAAARHATPAAPTSDEAYAQLFNDSIQVSREGFEFHVAYKTRFGENKTERLEAALETFQNMRLMRPHMNVQKSGIRLVVTRWDGDNFVEEHGLENLEHASPEEVEDLIKANVIGGLGGGGQGEGAAPRARRSRYVARVELARKPHDARYHLVHHLDDGRIEEGVLLVRANMSKLAAANLFRPGVAVSTTAMSDRIVITRPHLPGEKGPEVTEVLPLASDEDARRVEAILNQCLKPKPDEPLAPPAPAPPVATHAAPPVAPALDPVLASVGPVTSTFAVVEEPSPTGADALVSAEAFIPAADLPAKHEPPAPKPSLPLWMQAALNRAEGMPMEEVDAGVFGALSAAFECPPVLNEHDFPGITIEALEADGSVTTLELVQTPHYLLCGHPRGYIRFGPETRVFLSRLDDYIAFPGYALRGVVRRSGQRPITFVVSPEFADFLRSRSERAYHAQFASMLKSAQELGPEDDLVWPLSPEEQLFQALARTAASYGLPVKGDVVILDPNATEFIGFRKVPGHGIEFHDGEEFVRFTPAGVEVYEDGETRTFPVGDILVGLMLDEAGHVCAICREADGFTAFPDTKLLRFLSEAEAESHKDGMNVLAK